MYKKSVNIRFLIILIALIATSCTIQKRKYSNGFFVSSPKGILGISHKNMDADNSASPTAIFKKDIIELDEVKKETYSDTIKNQHFKATHLVDSTCDVIVFRDLKEVKCMVTEVNPETIKYKKCGFENGPIITIRKDKVSSILYRNGDQEDFINDEDEKNKGIPEKPISQKKTEGFGVAGLIIGIAAILLPYDLLALIVLMVIVSVIFGFISLKRFTTEPEKYSGKAFSILTLLLGLVTLILLSYLII